MNLLPLLIAPLSPLALASSPIFEPKLFGRMETVGHPQAGFIPYTTASNSFLSGACAIRP